MLFSFEWVPLLIWMTQNNFREFCDYNLEVKNIIRQVRALRRVGNQSNKMEEKTEPRVEDNAIEQQQAIMNLNLRYIQENSANPIHDIELSFIVPEILVESF